ncbi:flavodoxin domain-containing protein [Scytonema sp. PRP1]|uniref:flavodoxin domain-containing protein n=1 Tax=Scytonema sp. PRP1 TaxID=3120513 RepID=UPI002FCE9C39
MSKIGLLFGSTTGKTESLAEMIQKEFDGENLVTLHNILEAEDSEFKNYQDLIIGSPTWNVGGGCTAGFWSTNGYDFNESKALNNGKFVGLALDEDNQFDLTQEGVKTWVVQVKKRFFL